MKSRTSNNRKTFTREQLYKLVWSKSLRAVASKYNIPEYSLKEICKDNDIPLPMIGYWSKIKYNKEVEKTPLPKVENSKDTIAIELKPKNELSALKLEIETELKSYLIVPEKLTRPCDLIRIARKDLKIKKPRHYTDIEGFARSSKDIFNILVSKPLIKRALLFSDLLIKLLRKRGHQVTIIKNEKYSYNNGIRIVIDGEPYKFCVRETRKRIMKKGKYWDTAEYFPSGILTLRIEERYTHEWKDTANVPVENKLSHILTYLELRAKREIKERIAREIWNKEYKIQREIEKQIQQKRANELLNFEQLIRDSTKWQKAVNLRNYINTVEINAIKQNSLTDEIKDWLFWAKHKADWYDPLIEKEDELLSNINREAVD